MAKANSPASRKQKGRRAAMDLQALILKSYPGLLEDDVQITSSGACGEDVRLSPLARRVFPFTFEVKCQESLNIWNAIEQSESHAKGTNHRPLVAFRRNHHPLRIIVDAEFFLRLVADLYIAREVTPFNPKTNDDL